jgi:hypothetical protein
MGIEPTEPGSRRIPTGFEVQASHQARFTSAQPCDCNRNRPASNLKLQIIRHSDKMRLRVYQAQHSSHV